MALLTLALVACTSGEGVEKDESAAHTGSPDTDTGCCDSATDTAGDTAPDSGADTDSGSDTDTGPVVPYDLSGAPYVLEGATAWTVESTGDLDGDGEADFLVGDPMLYPGTSCTPGRAVLVRGPLPRGVVDLSSDSGQVWSLSGAVAGALDESTGVCEVGDEAGVAFAEGDVDADGALDLVVAARNTSAGGDGAGSVFIARGPLTGPMSLTGAAIQFHGDTGDGAGDAVAIGDVTGDGMTDLMIGLQANGEAATGAGAVVLVPGPFAEGSFRLADYPRWSGEAAYDHADNVVVADLDGDGVDDALVGAWGADRVYILRGPLDSGGTLADVADVAMGDERGVYLGGVLAAGVDVDGDGYNEWIAGAHGNGVYNGAAWVVSGSTAGSISSGDTMAQLVTSTYSEAGLSVAFPGDVDADGNPDVLVGAWHRAFLIYGPPAGVLELGVDGPGFFHADERAGGAVAGAGDVDGDGADDLLIGGTFYGAWIVLAADL